MINAVRKNMDNDQELDQKIIQKNNQQLKKLEERITVLQQEATKLESEIQVLLVDK